jgi:DNA-binding NtrC family response regulator
MIVTQSARMKTLINCARRVARTGAPVLLTGESGTGKELFAQLIHDESPRSGAKLVRLNCAALADGLIESELFGHEKGSFTDAVTQRKGRFELADQGSLLLDEISEVPNSTQAKLLRVLESNEFERVGSSTPIEHDVRIIASSNRNLDHEVKEGRFRLDLLHRINVVQLRIPALRDRREDVVPLAMHFLNRFKHESANTLEGFTREAMKKLSQHEWPGNIRELRNVVHRACIFSDEASIDENVLTFETPEMQSQVNSACETPADTKTTADLPEHFLQTRLADIEKQVIIAAIKRYGNRQIVAEKLGVSPRTLTNKIRLYRQDDSKAA